MHNWRMSQSYSPTPLDEESGDQFQFPSEPLLTEISMMDNGSIVSLDIPDDSASYRPTASPTPLEIPRRSHTLVDDEKTPLPDSHNHNHNTSNHISEQFLEELESPSLALTGTAADLFADHSSILDQESRIDSFEILASTVDGPPETAATNSNRMVLEDTKRESAKERSATLTLKEQEKTIDLLKKTNFSLKMKCYYFEQRLEQLSPEHMDAALKDNVKLKVSIEVLTKELKKYKKMILELNSTMELLQNSNQPCPHPHGMSAEEQINYEAALMESERSRDENKRLQKIIADLSAENSKLRASARTSRNSSPRSDPVKISRSSSNSSRPGDDLFDNDFWLNHRRMPSNKDMSNEIEMYRREWLQAKQTIERQNQTIQLLRDEASSQTFKSPSDGLFKSILSERDAYLSRVEHYQKTHLELQENLERLQGRNTEVTSQLIGKNKELDKMHENLDELMRSLHDTKQLLRSKTNEVENLRQELESLKARRKPTANVSDLLTTVDELRLENSDLVAHVAKLKRELKDVDNEHRNEVDKLLADIEKREQEFVAVEAKVIKVMAQAKKAETREKEKDMLIEELERKLDSGERNEYDDDEIEKLEQELQAKDDQIAEYERRMKEIESQDSDLSALEKRYAQIEESLQNKDIQIKDLEEELEASLEKLQDAKARYEEDLQILEQQFQEVEQAMRERDVRIASLEGHLEAQTDAVQREKGLHREEVKDLEDKLHELAELLREKDILLGNLEEQLEQRVAGARDIEEAYENDLKDIKEQLGSRLIDLEEEWKNRVIEVEQRLKETEEQLKKERRLANEKLTEAVNTKRSLHQKLEASSMKNGLMSNLLDQYQRSESRHSAPSSRANQTLTKLNQELQRELEERDQALQRETARLRELDAICARALREKEELKDLLIRRNSIITHLFERLESTQERKAVMESVLLRQATEEMDGSFHIRTDSAMSSR